MYQTLLTRAKQFTALATFSLLAQTSVWAGDLGNLHQSRPQHNPSCEPAFGFHQTCWRRIPSIPPCTTQMGPACGTASCSTGQCSLTQPVQSPYPTSAFTQPQTTPAADPFFSGQPANDVGTFSNTTSRYGINQLSVQPPAVPHDQPRHFSPAPVNSSTAGDAQALSPQPQAAGHLPPPAALPSLTQSRPGRYAVQPAVTAPLPTRQAQNTSPASVGRYGVPVRTVSFPGGHSTTISRYGNAVPQQTQGKQ
jgi:hypothetical protein